MTEAAHPVRINEHIEYYWETLRDGRDMPREAEVQPEKLHDIWGACFLVSARLNGSFAYNYLGDDLIDAYGDNIVGREITEALVYPHPQQLLNTFREVVAGRKPVTVEAEFTNSKGVNIKYRSCVVPLAGPDGTHVAFLLGGMKWKTY